MNALATYFGPAPVKESVILIAALIFCAALVALIATLCKIGERNRKIELDSIWGG
jgi:hypothetical protein